MTCVGRSTNPALGNYAKGVVTHVGDHSTSKRKSRLVLIKGGVRLKLVLISKTYSDA